MHFEQINTYGVCLRFHEEDIEGLTPKGIISYLWDICILSVKMLLVNEVDDCHWVWNLYSISCSSTIWLNTLVVSYYYNWPNCKLLYFGIELGLKSTSSLYAIKVYINLRPFGSPNGSNFPFMVMPKKAYIKLSTAKWE